ncbi:MAG: Rpn family recombination-promoting nuclease/putative transposase, partial [Clostridiales bacterium]|nr:Rpn family recombination-promoting nuclease/putative transposase [Clostridiales bacterium]
MGNFDVKAMDVFGTAKIEEPVAEADIGKVKKMLLPTVDTMFRKIFSSPQYMEATIGLVKDIFGIVLKDIDYHSPYNLDNVRIVNRVKKKVINNPTAQLSEEEQEVLGRYTIVDIRGVDSANIRIGIELQARSEAYFAERMLYYTVVSYSMMYMDSGRLRMPENRYSAFYPLYSLCILGSSFNLYDDKNILHIFNMKDEFTGCSFSTLAPI